MEDTMGTGMDIIMVVTTASALVAVHMLHTVSGAFVSVTVGTKKDMDDVNRTGQINREDQTTLILLLSVWTALTAKGWT